MYLSTKSFALFATNAIWSCIQCIHYNSSIDDFKEDSHYLFCKTHIGIANTVLRRELKSDSIDPFHESVNINKNLRSLMNVTRDWSMRFTCLLLLNNWAREAQLIISAENNFPLFALQLITLLYKFLLKFTFWLLWLVICYYIVC